MISLDTETTGLDFHHGASPFLITTCNESGEVTWWEWGVNPFTRRVLTDARDLDEIQETIDRADKIVLQNAKFDVQALNVAFCGQLKWDWSKVYDTLLAGHLLASNHPHDLTSMCFEYLNTNIGKYEDAIKKVCNECRTMIRGWNKVRTTLDGKLIPAEHWRVAKAGEPDMPSAKESTWKYDMWLPAAVADAQNMPVDHPYRSICSLYANADSTVTLALWTVQKRLLEARGLWAIYQERLLLLPVAYAMESRGITANRDRLDQLYGEYTEESDRDGRTCVGIADSYGVELKLPKSGNNKSLVEFTFGELGLEPVKRSKKTGNPSLDKQSLERYEATLPKRSKQLSFVRALMGKRKRDTALNYMEGYKRFWLPLGDSDAANDEKETEHLEKIYLEDESNDKLLDVDSREVRERLRTIPRSRGKQSAPGELPSLQGDDTERYVGSSHVRQESLCESESLVPGKQQRQLSGHGVEKQTSDRRKERVKTATGETSQGRKTSHDNIDRGASERDKDDLCIRKPRTRVRSISKEVRCDKDNHLQDNARRLLETRGGKLKDWRVLYPSLNITGTDTLRWSSSNPNEQNISKQENFNLRYIFGPAPSREWWSLDAKNIELRIPVYEAGEREMISLFEHEDDPPYYGSYHMLVFDTLHPEKFARHGMKCKEIYASTYYQWTKNGNFAVQYGAVESSGTADRAYHVQGAQRRIQGRFGAVTELNSRMIAMANRLGYVETIPDRSVDPDRGYPLLCTRSQYGDVVPTVPLSYHVQGTAMWWMARAMVRCYEYLQTLDDCYLIMQVHDELVFDFPKGSGRGDTLKYNLPKIRKLQRLMEQGGESIGVRTPVSIEHHSNTWSEGVSV